jgi:hypothetical protein
MVVGMARNGNGKTKLHQVAVTLNGTPAGVVPSGTQVALALPA